MARAIAPFLAARMPGARVIVSNKPGAGGQVGTEAVANAAPDGFTFGACATPTVLSQPAGVTTSPRYCWRRKRASA